MRRQLVLLSLLAAGCAGVGRGRPAPSAAADLEQVRTSKQGVCAGVGNIPGDAWSSDPRAAPKQLIGTALVGASAEVCARAEAEGGGLLDVTLIFPIGDERWRTENWHLEVIRKDGLVVQAATLEPGRVEAGVCVLDTCLQEDHATVRLSEPWQASTYRIRLRHLPTRTSADLAIALR